MIGLQAPDEGPRVIDASHDAGGHVRVKPTRLIGEGSRNRGSKGVADESQKERDVGEEEKRKREKKDDPRQDCFWGVGRDEDIARRRY